MRPIVSILILILPAVAALQAAPTAEQFEFFEKRIRPVLVEKCQMCHSPQMKTSGLDLSSAAGFVHGGESGSLIDRENLAASRLLLAIGFEEKLKMPPMGKLDAAALSDFDAWVKMGAPWPGAEEVAEVREEKPARQFSEDEKNFWAFRAVSDAAPPAVQDTSWVRSDIDRFILAKLEEKGVRPAAPAGKETLLRRASFDLTGLPPSEQEIAGFLVDDSAEAFEKVVDRLLASPRYGERWGRHWLDVARYADSTGNDEDHRYPYAWRYRDYVIEAFNQDRPYDEFVREQLAGDLLAPDAGSNINSRGIVATGFLALGPKAIAQQDKQRMLYDVYDEQLDVVAKGFLGLTLSCARCHDHKFDPLLQRDYYSMVGMFASTRSFRDPSTHVSKLLYVPLVPEEKYQAYRSQQDEIENKNLEVNSLKDEEVERYVSGLAPRTADFMLAAHSVLTSGREAAAVAAESGLEAEVLRKWVKYLAPNPTSRPYLNEWEKAGDGNRGQVAAAYQERFISRMDEWHMTLAKWRRQFEIRLKERNMPPPERPTFPPAEDRFFQEVYIDGGGPFGVPAKEQDKIFSAEAALQIQTLKSELDALKKDAMPEPAMACAVQEGEPVDQKVFIRGDYGTLGEDAPKVFPAIVAGMDQESAATSGSGRLELANWIASAKNPLTARVMVNRIWHWHFGEGLSRSPSNFGKTGEKPTHPELLDYLAKRFVEDGWSIKQMHRRMMLSSAYQMGTATSDAQYAADPENLLFSRFIRRRLDVEEIRDGLLAIDHSIDLKVGGTLQEGFGTDKENSNDRLSVDPAKYSRRTVYLPLRRANLPALFNLFDFGDAVTPQGRRALTNVAPQALFMMNSGFVAERSETLAKQLVASAGDETAVVEKAYRRILNRAPRADEIDQGLTYVSRLKDRFGGVEDEKAWASLCRVLMGSNEFIYVD